MRCEVVWPKVLSMRAWIGGPVEAVSFIFRSPPKLFLVFDLHRTIFGIVALFSELLLDWFDLSLFLISCSLSEH